MCAIKNFNYINIYILGHYDKLHSRGLNGVERKRAEASRKRAGDRLGKNRLLLTLSNPCLIHVLVYPKFFPSNVRLS